MRITDNSGAGQGDPRIEASPFDELAAYYDWEHSEFEDDLPLYLSYAERLGGPILEAGCGTGRLLLPLARAGYQTVGVDSSSAMLQLARAKIDRDETLRERIALREGDFRSIQLGQEFRLIILALDSLGLLTVQADQVLALRALSHHLAWNGLLLVDVANGNLRGGEAAEESVLHLHKSGETSQHQIVKWVTRRTDHSQQIDYLVQMYDETSGDGLVRRRSVELELRYFTRFELELLLERAGLAVEAVFGDYELTPFGPESQRLIVAAHRSG